MTSAGIKRAAVMLSVLAGAPLLFAQSDMRGHWSGAVDTPNGSLALEVDLIQTLADDLNTMLINRDPLSQSVHHSKMDVAALFVKRFPAFALMRLRRPRPS